MQKICFLCTFYIVNDLFPYFKDTFYCSYVEAFSIALFFLHFFLFFVQALQAMFFLGASELHLQFDLQTISRNARINL